MTPTFEKLQALDPIDIPSHLFRGDSVLTRSFIEDFDIFNHELISISPAVYRFNNEPHCILFNDDTLEIFLVDPVEIKQTVFEHVRHPIDKILSLPFPDQIKEINSSKYFTIMYWVTEGLLSDRWTYGVYKIHGRYIRVDRDQFDNIKRVFEVWPYKKEVTVYRNFKE